MSIFDHTDASPEWVQKVNVVLTEQASSIADLTARIAAFEGEIAAMKAWKAKVEADFGPTPNASF